MILTSSENTNGNLVKFGSGSPGGLRKYHVFCP